jgi:hypothetical protein
MPRRPVCFAINAGVVTIPSPALPQKALSGETDATPLCISTRLTPNLTPEALDLGGCVRTLQDENIEQIVAFVRPRPSADSS